MSLPSGLNFQIPETADSLTRVFEKQIRPDSGTEFTETELIRFTIPKGKYGSVIDPEGTYLSFKLQAKRADTNGSIITNVCGHPSSVIKRMNIFAGSTQIEQVREYGLIHHMTMANTQPMDGGYNNMLLSGKRAQDTITEAEEEMKTDNQAIKTEALSILQTKSPLMFGGHKLDSTQTTFANSSNIKERVITPLMSGVIGTTARKHFPVSLTANGLALELVLGSNQEVLQAATPTAAGAGANSGDHAYEISEVILTLKYLEIPPEIFSQLAPTGTVSLNTEMYTALNTADLAQTTQATIIIPARYRSLKTLITVMRDSDVMAIGKNSFDFTANNIRTWQYALGSELYPLTPCEGLVNSYRQLLSAYDMEDFDAENQIFPASWSRHGDGDANVSLDVESTLNMFADYALPQGRFVMAVSMEKFRAKSGLMFNGTSSIAENIMLHLNFDGDAASETTKLTHVVHYDAIITIGGGEASVSF